MPHHLDIDIHIDITKLGDQSLQLVSQLQIRQTRSNTLIINNDTPENKQLNRRIEVLVWE